VGRRGRSWLLYAMLVPVINLPIAQSLTTQHRLDVDGVDVEATLVDRSVDGPADDPTYYVTAQLPAESGSGDGAEGPIVSAPVDRTTYDDAGATGSIGVRILPSRPGTAYRFDGEQHSRLGLWITLAADALLAGLVLLLWRTGRSGGGEVLRIEATADVAAAAGEPPVPDEELRGDELSVTGIVLEASDDEVLLDLGDRTAHVLLDGHGCRVPVGASGVARGRRLG
jgi:hypothetical protein